MNKKSPSCPCCGSPQLLRHARHQQLYWYCMSCRQEVLPLISTTPLSDLVLPQPQSVS